MIEVDEMIFERLVRDSARLEIAREYVNIKSYVDKGDLKVILGIDVTEEEDE